MKAEVCNKCNNCDEEGVCSRYDRHISKINACGIFAGKRFHKPFNRRGVENVIGHRGRVKPVETGI